MRRDRAALAPDLGETDRVPVAVRPPEPHELDAVVACEEAAFSQRMGSPTRRRAAEALDDDLIRVAVLEGELVGTLASFPVELTLPGGVLAPAAALSGVAVLPTHRRRGVLRALMTRALEESRKRGQAFATLYASEARIYGRFGFGPAVMSAAYRVPRSAATLRAAVAPGAGRVRLLRREEAVEVFPAVFDLARRLRPGEIERPLDWWSSLLEPEPEQSRGMRLYAAYERDGRVDGYVCYELDASPVVDDLGDGFPHRELRVLELTGLTDEAYRALWAFVLEVDLVGAVVTGRRPLDEPLRFLLADPRGLVVCALTDHTWLRLVDLAAALGARRYDAPGRLVLEVDDPSCPWNRGRYALEVDPSGGALVERCEEAADLSCDAAVLAAAYLGGVGWSALGAAGAAVAHVEDALARADRLFASRPAPFCTADF